MAGAFAGARRLGIVRWWAASFALTFAVGIATVIPFFLLVRDFMVDKRRTVEVRPSRLGWRDVQEFAIARD